MLAAWLARLSPRLCVADLCLNTNNITAVGARAIRHAVRLVPDVHLSLEHNLCAC